MKQIVILLSLIVSVGAQNVGVIKNIRDFDEPPFDRNVDVKRFPRIPSLLKSSIANSNPEFVSVSSDSVYEDSTYLFNVLTNDPDGDAVSVSISSNPSWLSFSSKEGGLIRNITKNYMFGNDAINGSLAVDLANMTPDASNGTSWTEYDLEYYNGEIYYSADTYIGKIKAVGTIEVVAGQYGITDEKIYENSNVDTAKFYDIKSFTHDSDGNLYVADWKNFKIFKINNGGIITTYAGNGNALDPVYGSLATSGGLYGVYDIIFDSNGNLYIVAIAYMYKVDTNGIISHYGGNGGSGYTGDSGLATSASFWATETAFDADGNLYFSDATVGSGENVIRKIDKNGIITTVVGDGSSGYTGDGGLATSAQINKPRGLIFDSSGILYFSDSGNNVLRTVNKDGVINTIAGKGIAGFSGDNGQALVAEINNPDDIIIDDSGNIIFYDVGNGRIRKIDTSGVISTIAGTNIYNGERILASTARSNLPRNPAFDKHGNLFVAEQQGHRIRKIDRNGIITTVAGNGNEGFSGDGGSAIEAMISNPRAVAVDDTGNIYISDVGNIRIRKVDTNGIITTYAGTGESGYSGDGSAATLAKISFPYQLAIDKNSNIYFAEYGNDVIRKVDTNGIISTVAGNGTYGYSGDGSAATSAQLKSPLGVAFDSEDNMYIGDYDNNVIRKVDSNGIISTVAGTGTAGYSGDGGMATSANLYRPTALTVDLSGNIYFCDTYNEVVRRISKNGIISTIAGTGTQGYSGNGGAATSAKLYRPYGIAVDSLNNIYITDSWNYVIRKIDASYHTLTGTPTNSDVGTTTMTFTASDRQGGSATQSFALKVINTNDPPVLASITNVTTNEDTAKTVTLSGTDVDGDALTYSAVSDTSAVTVSVSSATLTLAPAADWYGTSTITAYVSDGTVKDSTSFTLTVTAVNDAPVITAVTNDSTNEETEKAIVLDASDVDGDALTYTATSDTSGVAVTISSDTLKLTPALNYTGTSVITVIVSDNALTDTTKFEFKVINVNDAPVLATVDDDSTQEDSDGKGLKLSASDVEGDALTYSAVSDTTGLTVSVLNDSISLKPVPDYFGTSIVKAFVSDGQLSDSTTFTFKVLNIQDAPKAFEWMSTALDSINISQSNLADTYSLQWDASTDVDGDSIHYLVSAKIGVYPSELIYDTTVTTLPLSYQEIVENVFEGMPNERATVLFTVSATDGIDTVKVTGDDRALFVNRYDYLSTEEGAIPTEFALHENYPNPFNPTTTLRFDLPEVSDATVTIFNMLGQKIKTFNMNDTPAGYHSIKWNATNDYGDPVGAGVYLYQLRANQFVKTKKMVLLK